jgi:hypothetical protein
MCLIGSLRQAGSRSSTAARHKTSSFPTTQAPTTTSRPADTDLPGQQARVLWLPAPEAAAQAGQLHLLPPPPGVPWLGRVLRPAGQWQMGHNERGPHWLTALQLKQGVGQRRPACRCSQPARQPASPPACRTSGAAPASRGSARGPSRPGPARPGGAGRCGRGGGRAAPAQRVTPAAGCTPRAAIAGRHRGQGAHQGRRMTGCNPKTTCTRTKTVYSVP